MDCICGYDIGHPLISRHSPPCIEYRAMRKLVEEVIALSDNMEIDEVDRDCSISEAVQKYKLAIKR